MNKVSRDNTKKLPFVILTIAILLISTMSVTTTISHVNADALDLFNVEGIDDIGQSAECVIVVVGCDATGSVGSSGDTIIGSNNGNNDNNTNGGGSGPELGTISVTKEVRCDAPFEDPEYCAFAEASPNFPEPSDYQITITGNNPDPSNFPGSTTGTPVEIGAGDYTITESEPSLAALSAELGATATNILDATGDCIPGPPNQNFTEATGTMTPGGSQTCNIINIVQII